MDAADTVARPIHKRCRCRSPPLMIRASMANFSNRLDPLILLGIGDLLDADPGMARLEAATMISRASIRLRVNRPGRTSHQVIETGVTIGDA